MSSAAALANLDIFEAGRLSLATVVGWVIIYMTSCSDCGIMRSWVMCEADLGLLAAVELVQDRASTRRRSRRVRVWPSRLPPLLFENGLVTFRAGDVISLCPPLMVDKDEVDFIVDAS